MASINQGTLTVDFEYRPRNRSGVMVAGRIKMGAHDALIRPQDIGLRTIRSIVATPGAGTPAALLGSYVGYKNVLLHAYIGSIGALDTSRAAGTPGGNYVRLRTSLQGSPFLGYGTAMIGSVTVPFMAFGE